MNRKFKFLVFLLLLLGEIIINLYIHQLKFNFDFLYLILVYISVKSGFLKSMFSATFIGLITDFLSMQLMGVFGFSRTFSAFLIHESSRLIDLKNNFFVFFLITISLSVSNFIANFFFFIIQDIGFSWRLIVFQPLFTGLLGILIISSKETKRRLDVY